jgi:CRISPR-associated endonuclease/helicase Cas3
MQTDYFAHSANARGEWHDLHGHLTAVAKLASRFAEAFGAGEWAELAGLWHDVGKYQPQFQQHLRGDKRKVDHSVIGAALARTTCGARGYPLAFTIAGHHGGLADRAGQEATPPVALDERLEHGASALKNISSALPPDFLRRTIPRWPARLEARRVSKEVLRGVEFWTRFLFSALVDADFLDTEAFYEPTARSAVQGFDTVSMLRARLDKHIDSLQAGAAATEVNRVRAEVLAACRSRAQSAPGIFTLTVPTGGGKTLAAMAFALRHAEEHGLHRVVVAIPYTTIIEQSAAVYRSAFGETNVVEHHANLDPETETERNRLASENWDAPVIVTTNVQLFESLFANRPSRCRKLHNLARSVIILDEVQTVPSGFLLSIVEALRELFSNYGCTVVLSTATQPALRARESFPGGLTGAEEIAPSPPSLFARLRRVEVDWNRLTSGPVSWERLADEIAGHERVLAVVHGREDARLLAGLLPAEGRFHLSALMCARHREATLARVKESLRHGPCRLVSTQLIEAGVDIDFPVVYRALGGLDSVAQAAGRCNREGRREPGKVVVFRAPTSPPRGTPCQALQVTEAMLGEEGGGPDLNDPKVYERFFSDLYFGQNLDAENIQTLRQDCRFASIARRFKLIEDGLTFPIVVPYPGAEERVTRLRRDGPSRETLRSLQPFLVSLYAKGFSQLCEAGALEPFPADGPMVYGLTQPYRHLYDPVLGLVLGDPFHADPSALIT